MAALGADIVGAGLGYIPKIGDIANLIVSGIGATAFGAVADSQRVKHGELPEGTAWKNAIANIGADVVSIVPVVGDTYNIGKGVRRASFLLSKILSYGNTAMVLQNSPAI